MKDNRNSEILNFILKNPESSSKEIHEGIDRLTAEELMVIANKYFHPETLSTLIFDCKK